MNNSGSPPIKRARLSGDDLSKISKDEIIQLYIKQQETIAELESKTSDIAKETGDKSKILESTRRENVLVMRLATKEQELQQYAAQIAHIKKSQQDVAAKSLREAFLDPAVNLLFDKMKNELKETKDKLEQAQSELSAWKFTPDSQTGKKLMSRCRTLIAENQELGKQLSQGKVAQLEAELALQKKYSEDLKESQEELNEFVIQLDEEVEGMQSTIQLLQQQLNEARKELDKYKKFSEEPPNVNKSRTKDRFALEKDVHPTNILSESIKRNVVKNEAGVSKSDLTEAPKSPVGTNYGNMEFVCKEECDFEKENSDFEENSQNATPSDHSPKKYDKFFEGGEQTPSEDNSNDMVQEIALDEIPKSDSSPENEIQKYDMISPEHQDLSPMNDGETYAVIDNGSDDEQMSQVAPKVEVSSHQSNENLVVTLEQEIASPNNLEKNSDKESMGNITLADRIEKMEVAASQENPEFADDDAVKSHKDRDINDCVPITESTTINVPNKDKVDDAEVPKNTPPENLDYGFHAVTAAASDTPGAAPEVVTTTAKSVEEVTSLASLSKSQPELKLPPVNGPQAAMPSLTHSLISPAQLPLVTDPTSYLMNPHFQHLPGASAALAQQQAILAEQAMIYKSMLVQQQQQHLVVNDDKTNQLSESKTGDDIRTTANPLLTGLPFADPSAAAYLAQYKAMLAARPVFMPGPDGKTPQMLAPGSLGLYPGLPLIQPPVLTQPQSNEHGTPNSVAASWPASTNVTLPPHPLVSQGFLNTSTNPGMMAYVRHNMAVQSVGSHSGMTEMDKHRGSGDHHPVSNGLPSQKTQDSTDSNATQEGPQLVV